MSFVSLHFAVFFVIVTSLYFAIPVRAKWAFLLVVSLYFYMSWVPVFIFLLLFSIVLNYVFGILIDVAEKPATRRAMTALGIVANLVPLFFYKYFNFANLQLGALLHGGEKSAPFLPGWDIALPIGISFFTFQALSYLIDVHRRLRPAEWSIFNYGLYHSYFPQLVAGPIERSTRLLPQLIALRYEGGNSRFAFDSERVASGLRLILWGLFKKLVIADNLSVVVDEIYAGPDIYSGTQLLFATYFFAYQIYCDFSGYTDIARGVSRIFGIELMVNFDSPYAAKSIQEFWRRWHISLSTWFRDYVFLPLGGSHTGFSRWAFNIVVVFVLSGIWHGANWTFIAWGALHAIYYLVGRLTARPRDFMIHLLGLNRIAWGLDVFRIFLTFHLVVLAWVFFRAASIGEAFLIVKKIALDVSRVLGEVASLVFKGEFSLQPRAILNILQIELPSYYIIVNDGIRNVVVAVLVLELADYLRRRTGKEFVLTQMPVWIRWTGYYTLACAIWILAPFGSRQFIYFQF